jgi:hypothetical protein
LPIRALSTAKLQIASAIFGNLSVIDESISLVDGLLEEQDRMAIPRIILEKGQNFA